MASILRALKVVADPTRVRILRLLGREELAVAELQEILSIGQSTLSSHLAQLRQAGLVEDRKSGKHVRYSLRRPLPALLMGILEEASREMEEVRHDEEALALVLEKRRQRTRAYFDELAGRFGRHYMPGRSWKAFAEALLALLPEIDAADLGAGEGAVAFLLARRARHVYAVDSSPQMVDYGRRVAAERGFANVEYRLGDLESLPLENGCVDVAVFSQSLHHAQHPEKAVAEAWRILRPGGRIVVLDLAKHNREEARELYADEWLGFTEVEMRRFLREAGFEEIETSVVHREEQPPHFETLLAVAVKPAATRNGAPNTRFVKSAL
ncbi:MAG: metalloregulator ArsR/SmtB family transcription factor [Bryobacteraceae bacterium]